MSHPNTRGEVTVRAENIGGITDCEVTFDPGVTILKGRNATGRTSLLTAIAGALGGSAPSLKSDADEGFIALECNGSVYSRNYTRTVDGLQVSGEPLSERDDLIDRFICLTSDNPARRAIVSDGNLRDIIMRPVDTDAIQRRIEELQSERNRLGQRIRTIEEELERRPALESRKRALEAELDEQKREITNLQEHLEQYDTDPKAAEVVEETLRSLEDQKQELRSVQNRIQTQQDTIKALRDEQQELETELDSLDTAEEELNRLEARLSEFTSRKRSLATTINDLSAIVDFNEDLVSSGDSTFITTDKETQSPVSQLNPMTETVRCWTCGSQVQRDDIADRLVELRGVINEKRNERAEIQIQIEELRTRQRELQDGIDRQSEANRRLTEIKSEIERREGILNALKDEREGIRDRLSELEDYISKRNGLHESTLVDQYQRLSELEYERGQLEEEMSSVRNDLAEIDRLDEEYDQLQAQQREIREELKQQRIQIRDLEKSAIESFNEHMMEILDVLSYSNVARIWIERKDGVDFETSHGGYRGGSATRFDLHVVRETSEGTGYEETVANLSESEREVIRLIVALAGYLVHDVNEVVPMMLLDSLEAIDANRIAALVDYFAEFVPYLIVALLPEDAATLTDDYSYVTADQLAP